MLTSFIFSYFLLSSLYICRESSTNPPLFIQNKPNFRKSQMNVTFFDRSKYVKLDTLADGKNKPKQTQNKANSNPIQTQSQKCQK